MAQSNVCLFPTHVTNNNPAIITIEASLNNGQIKVLHHNDAPFLQTKI